MVLSNSTPNNNHKQHELIVDTAAMNSEDLSELIQLNAEIEERRRSRHSQHQCSEDGRGLLRATMTREELFEVSSLDDDRFLTALEYQNSYVPPSRLQVTDLDLSSIENLMKYFDEEVPVTPSKSLAANCTGKVASAIAKLSSQQSSTVTSPRQPKPDSGKLKISELKQKYEQNLPQGKQESQLASPQAVRGSRLPMKVKEMAQLFNTKFNQVMRRVETPHYSELHNELSRSLSPVPKSPGPCLVAEDVFRELSVKDKVLLFNKFVSDFAAKHPKFNEHAADLRAQAKRQMARGEVVAEQQASVKHLAQELEAKCSLQATPVPRMRSLPVAAASASAPAPAPVAAQSTTTTPSKLHVSTLTVVLKPSPERHVFPLSTFSGQQCESQTSQKRNLAAIRSAMPTEAYAPPKKIRRTRQERSGNDSHPFFQNEPLENLFYNWLSAENGVLFDITSVANREQTIEIATSFCEELPISQATASSIGDMSQKSAVERLLEEAIAKLELESKSKESTYVEEKDVDTAAIMAPALTPEVESSTAPATPTPRKTKRKAPPVPAPRPSLAKTQSNSITSSSSSSCRQSGAEESESGLSTLPKITSDESQPETTAIAAVAATDFDFVKPVRPPRKKKMRRTLTWKKENSIVEATANAVISTDSDSDYKKPQAQQAKKKPVSMPQPQAEQSYVGLDKSLMRQVNSPRKIKSAYTLTVMSSPSPNADSDQSLSQTPRQSLVQTEQEKEHQENKQKQQQQQLRDSFIDQGFETGSNDAIDFSPLRRPSSGGKPSGFSTPIKCGASAGAKQQLFSPTGPLDKSRRSSIVMQVIREDHPLDLDLDSPTATTPTCSEREFFANAPTVEMSSSQLDDESPKTSKFWIGAGDFTISLDIIHNSVERLRLLFEIFTQKSWETREITFGIDGHKFSRSPCGAQTEVPKDLPEHSSSCGKDFSHYWFASGDLAVPFSGKHMSSEKIERLFRFLDVELGQDPERELRFGVDNFEFSSVPEFWVNTPKFSMESSYSMLVGLQTGNSNGLEGRSKYAWPNHPHQDNDNSNQAIKTSDLDQTEFESDNFSNNSGRLSFSPDLFSQDYEAVPLDELFNKTLPKERSSISNSKASGSSPLTMPQMLRTLQEQQTRLQSVEQRIRNYEMPIRLNESTLKKCRSKPEYAQRLKSIDNIARANGFSACSMSELEGFMQFLIEYADVCLSSCSEHIEKIVDSLMDRRAVTV